MPLHRVEAHETPDTAAVGVASPASVWRLSSLRSSVAMSCRLASPLRSTWLALGQAVTFGCGDVTGAEHHHGDLGATGNSRSLSRNEKPSITGMVRSSSTRRGTPCRDLVERLAAVPRLPDAPAVALQHRTDAVAHVGVVVDHEHVAVRRPETGPGSRAGASNPPA